MPSAKPKPYVMREPPVDLWSLMSRGDRHRFFRDLALQGAALAAQAVVDVKFISREESEARG